ncbi:MAG TPA: hypothetical protein VJ909_08245 [Prolixibacteraceae bacterium]|nr:hypothetical protein [Prolixibacteraceae bacterium]
MKNIKTDSQESIEESSSITGLLIDKDDLNAQDFPNLKKRLKHKMLSYFVPMVVGLTMLFLIKGKITYDYILFFVILMFSAILYYLHYKNKLLKLKLYFSSKNKDRIQ